MVGQRRRSRPSGASRAFRPTVVIPLIALLAAACGGATSSASAPAASAPAASQPAASTPASPAAETLKVFGAFATEIEEPWDGVIHTALEEEKAARRVEYSFQDAIGYSGDMERVLREVSERDQPDVIFGDAFGNEEAARRVAAEYPDVAFVFGSGGGPAEPNFSVFDNWIHEPAYLAGMLAGGLTKSNTLGVVGGYPVPEVNRIVNAFIGGAKRSTRTSRSRSPSSIAGSTRRPRRKPPLPRSVQARMFCSRSGSASSRRRLRTNSSPSAT